MTSRINTRIPIRIQPPQNIVLSISGGGENINPGSSLDFDPLIEGQLDESQTGIGLQEISIGFINIQTDPTPYLANENINEDTLEDGDASTLTFSFSTMNSPINSGGYEIAAPGRTLVRDDGAGSLVGAELDSGGTNTIVYSTGAVVVTWDTGNAPTAGNILNSYEHLTTPP